LRENKWYLEQTMYMWEWLARTGESNKLNYFIKHKIYDMPHYSCYLCEMLLIELTQDCSRCEVFAEEWKKSDYSSRPCYIKGSPYRTWSDNIDNEDDNDYEKEIKKEARQMAAQKMIDRIKVVLAKCI
jgi:hypothetical protein